MRLGIFLLILVAQLVSATEYYSEAILKTLSTSPVTSMVPMEDFLKKKGYQVEFYGDVYHLTLKDGTEAVFKALLPDDYGDIHAEVAAFKASQFLGFPRVPPTVIRKIKGTLGSLHLYEKPSVDALKPGVYQAALKEVDKEELANLKLFYFVFGQWDTGPRNIIIQKKSGKTHLIAIDNSGIRNRQYVQYGHLPFVLFCYSDKLNTQDFSDPFPFEQVKFIKNRSAQTLKLTFDDKLEKEDLKRLTRNNRGPLYYVIYQNALWIQFNQNRFNKNNSNCMLAHTDYYPPASIRALRKLNRTVLKEIFSSIQTAPSNTNTNFFTEKYVQSFLERRDQVLRAAEQQTQNVQ